SSLSFFSILHKNRFFGKLYNRTARSIKLLTKQELTLCVGHFETLMAIFLKVGVQISMFQPIVGQ
ncbi:hypothetical protein, partial [Enterococcus faecium]|uniref:hypothetical protein n=2 Tax=Enterococcus TaxID=1350 RepID=UPI001E4B9917